MGHPRPRPTLAVMRLFRARRRWQRILLLVGVGLVAGFALAQVVPYGRDHANPPVTKEPAWDTPRTRLLAARACFDCHSNLTSWRWYSNVAPVSWLVSADVKGGRSQFDFSEWDKPQDVNAGDLADAIRSGSMPPWFYKLAHGSASLSGAEREELIAGLSATLAASPPLPGGRGG